MRSMNKFKEKLALKQYLKAERLCKRGIVNELGTAIQYISVTGQQCYAQANGFPKYKKNNLRREARSGLPYKDMCSL